LEQGLSIFGSVFMQFFGQTECPNFITKLSKQDHSLELEKLERLKSCGRPVMMVNVRVVDGNGQEVPRGEVREIVCSSPYVMNEYYKLPDKTQEAIVEGWLHTGDIGKWTRTDTCIYLIEKRT
jgi:fatty-acyl-CoA synthase